MILTGETEVLGVKHNTASVEMNECVWSIGRMILTGETEVLGEKELHHIYRITWTVWDRARSAVVRGRLLTA
jgi:hypothetical protein